MHNKELRWGIVVSRYISWINIFAVAYLAAPKVNIFDIPGFRQGLRLEDFLILSVAASIIPFVRSLSINRFVAFLILFLVLNIFFGLWQPGSPTFKVAFFVRYLEYIVFYWIIFTYRSKLNVPFIFVSFVVIQLVPSLAQSLERRAYGTTAGPWELVSVVGVLGIYLLYTSATSWRKISYLMIFFAFVVLTESRISVLYVSLLLVAYAINGRPSPLLATAFVVGLLAGGVVFLTNLEEDNRYASAFSIDNLNMVVNFAQQIGQQMEIDPYAESGDLSLAVRLSIWANLVNTFSDGIFPFNYIFGVGLGANGVVVDGFYVRLIFETGAIGVLLFYYYSRKALASPEIRQVWVFLMVSCITLDPFTSSKISAALIIVLVSKQQNRIRCVLVKG